MKGVDALSDLKLRISYGENGNNNIGDYPSIPTIASGGYVLGTTPAAVIGQAPNVLASPDLRWERSKTYDVGVDFGFLNNRITGSIDYFSSNIAPNTFVEEAWTADYNGIFKANT